MVRIPNKVSERMADRKEYVRLEKKKAAARRRLEEGKKKRYENMSEQMKKNMKGK